MVDVDEMVVDVEVDIGVLLWCLRLRSLSDAELL